MISIENNSGRLIEIRQTGKVTIAEIQASFPQFQKAAQDIGGPIVLATDWRGMQLLDRETSDFLIEIMKNDEGVDAQVVITDQSALIGLQIRRLFRSGGGKRRAVFDDVPRAATFLQPQLTRAESAALRSFLGSYAAQA